MKKLSPRGTVRALTLVEVLLVLSVVAILMILFLPALNPRPKKSTLIPCLYNQRHIGLSLSMFAGDNNGHFPPQVSVTNGGSMEFIGSNSPALHYRTLSHYMIRNWSKLCCPADKAKQPCITNSPLTDRNISYFISVDATPTLTNAILAGDRNLEAEGKPVAPGIFALTTNVPIGWTRELHKFQLNGVWEGRGNLLFADGHVEARRTDLPVAIQRQGLATNRLAVP